MAMLHTDTEGLWLVWCDLCDKQLGEAVPLEMAEAKEEGHRAQHIKSDTYYGVEHRSGRWGVYGPTSPTRVPQPESFEWFSTEEAALSAAKRYTESARGVES